MIVIDFSQICIASYMQVTRQYNELGVDLELFRHTMLNSLRAINMKFRTYSDYSRLILAVDTPNSWRKQFFPYYKASRDDAKKASTIDWAQLYQCINTVRVELLEIFPYQHIRVNGAEADDIIGALTRFNTSQNKHTLIVSGDKDFIQLQADNELVRQWDNVNKRYHDHDDPKRYLFEHVFKGDRGDGIPNVLSPDNAFVMKIRQKPIRQKLLDECWNDGINFEKVDKTYLQRNIKLVDLRKTPKEISDQVIKEYNEFVPKPRVDLFKYFVDKQLQQLASCIGDFK